MMKPVVLLLTLLGAAASAPSKTVSRVDTSEVTYVLKVQSDAPDPSHPDAERRYVLQAFHIKDRKTLWTAAVEPEARNLYLAGSVLLTYSCFSGAYLACRVQAFSTGKGRELWKTSGKLGKVGANFVLLWDDFFERDDTPNLYVKLHVVQLPEGTRKSYTLRVPPRSKCGGVVELLDVTAFSTSSLETSLRDSCGTYTRTFR